MMKQFWKYLLGPALAAVLICLLPHPAWAQLARKIVVAQGGRLVINGPAPAAGDKTKGLEGLHLEQAQAINSYPYAMTDSEAYRWDIYYNGTVNSGTNNCYSGGMNLQINNSNYGSNGRASANKEGDEIEMQMSSPNNVRQFRRVKVFKDAPVARWLDIFENPGAETTFDITLMSGFCYQVGGTASSTGHPAFDKTDWAIANDFQNNGSNTPALMHVVCDRKSRLRPTVQFQNNTMMVRYRLTLPANSTVILASFESQGKSLADQTKFMNSFRPSRYLKDLPTGVRKCIVNFPGMGGVGVVDLDRNESTDSIMLTNEDPILGSVTNDSFVVETLFGKLTLPAKKIVGMAATPGGGGMRVLLTDGQIVSGKVGDQKLQVTLPTGGTPLQVPLDRVRQWSFRVSEERPAEVEIAGPSIILRTGDQLLFDPKAMPLEFVTRHGRLAINGSDLLEITMDNAGNSVHRATFANGTRLGGFLEPQNLTVPIKLGDKLPISRDMVSKIVFGQEEKLDPSNTRVVLNNDDELAGRVEDVNLKITTDFGVAEFKPRNVKSLKFSATDMDRAVVQLWDGSTLRGRLQQNELTFQILPGPVVKVSTSQVVSLLQSQSQPPDQILKQVDALVARLGAESYKDREDATAELLKLGPGVATVLQKYLKDNDPEVRQRVGLVLEKLRVPAEGPNPAMNNMPGRVFFK